MRSFRQRCWHCRDWDVHRDVRLGRIVARSSAMGSPALILCMEIDVAADDAAAGHRAGCGWKSEARCKVPVGQAGRSAAIGEASLGGVAVGAVGAELKTPIGGAKVGEVEGDPAAGRHLTASASVYSQYESEVIGGDEDRRQRHVCCCFKGGQVMIDRAGIRPWVGRGIWNRDQDRDVWRRADEAKACETRRR